MAHKCKAFPFSNVILLKFSTRTRLFVPPYCSNRHIALSDVKSIVRPRTSMKEEWKTCIFSLPDCAFWTSWLSVFMRSFCMCVTAPTMLFLAIRPPPTQNCSSHPMSAHGSVCFWTLSLAPTMKDGRCCMDLREVEGISTRKRSKHLKTRTKSAWKIRLRYVILEVQFLTYKSAALRFKAASSCCDFFSSSRPISILVCKVCDQG